MSLNPPHPSPRRTVSLTVLIVVIVLVAGAAVGTTATYYALHPRGTGSSGGNGTTTVIDDLGRSVTVPLHPTRVVVLGSSIVDSLVLLGLRASIVGVDCSSSAFGGILGDYTPAQVAEWNLSGGMCITAYPALDPPQILNLSPQLILAASIVSESAMESFQATYGIPVVFLAPSTIGGITYDVQVLNAIFLTGSTGIHLVQKLQRTIQQSAGFVTNLTDNGTALRSILLTYYVVPSGGYAGYSTFGPGSFGQSLIDLAGGVNIAGGTDQGQYPSLSGGQVLSANPSVIVAGYGFGVTNSTYATGPDWSSLPAVIHGNVSYVDVTLMTEADPSMVFWIPTLAHLLYPGVPFA
ncbi:periplasmic binding protein [mine drainage metagenome]|uniref:Periplasmic binding protein n=1 Tax=mine drainage metagenome TaxID=410659 RepID=T1AC20_9ZZZZ